MCTPLIDCNALPLILILIGDHINFTYFVRHDTVRDFNLYFISDMFAE